MNKRKDTIPIRFRAWDNTHQQFDEIVAANLLSQMHDPNDDLDEEYETRFILDAWIGTYDRNGVRIYTNDIVACWDEYDVNKWRKTDVLRQIKYDDVELGYAAITKGGDWCKCTKGNAMQMEVVGNIYQNKTIV